MNGFIYIAGAHSRGQTLKEYITTLYPEVQVAAYLVSDLSNHETVIDGIKVQEIGKESGLHTEYPVYIATKGIYHKKITSELRLLGMQQIYPVDVAMDSELRNAYVRNVYSCQNRKFDCIDDMSTNGTLPENAHRVLERGNDAVIYVASSVYDKKLASDYQMTPDEKIIQVGAAFTNERIPNAVAVDCTGDNISTKNKQYCELTALYWIWKNTKHDIAGLVHYRRHFLLPDHWIDRMHDNQVDVILPVPLYVAPDLAENYKNRHDKKEWDCMMRYLEEYLPDDYEKAGMFFQGSLYSPCNMFIMRREILEQLCEWLFPILDAVVECCGQKEDRYQNRYPGFLSERLMTYFFEGRKNHYRVVYANKNFLKGANDEL